MTIEKRNIKAILALSLAVTLLILYGFLKLLLESQFQADREVVEGQNFNVKSILERKSVGTSPEFEKALKIGVSKPDRSQAPAKDLGALYKSIIDQLDSAVSRNIWQAAKLAG